MGRIDSVFLGKNAGLLSTTQKTPGGATPGEMTFSSATSLPTVVGDAQFAPGGADAAGIPLAASKAVTIGARLTGAGAPSQTVVFRIGFWNPITEAWYMSTGFRVLADNLLDDDTNYLDGNTYFVPWPRWATLGMSHAKTLPATTNLVVAVSRDA